MGRIMSDGNDKPVWIVIGFLVTGIVGIYGFFVKHISCHVSKKIGDSVVYQDTCEARRDCIEQSVEGLKELIVQRFEQLEKLINGQGDRGT